MRIIDWSSDVCSSDLARDDQLAVHHLSDQLADQVAGAVALAVGPCDAALGDDLVEQAAFGGSSFSLRCGFGFALGHACMPLVDDGCRSGSADGRSEEHTSELQSLMRISYAVFCLKKKRLKTPQPKEHL